jgi:oxygen-independent coproporphyrinogen-3 oxidase
MSYSLYFHIPFCVHRCAYCDFNTYAGQEASIPAYVDALIREVEAVAAEAPERLPVHTIFFGGGTPSLLTAGQFDKILRSVRENFDLQPTNVVAASPAPETTYPHGALRGVVAPEISLEANPGTVSLEALQGLRQAGFNRISFGVQSARPDELRQLERIHDFFDVIDSVKWARQAGFTNLNLDLIYGLPEQTLARWQESLHRAVELGPEHLSLYALTIEHGTPFGRWMAQGLMPLPDPDLVADMYEWASEFLEGQGFEQYEISNWTRPGTACRHNLQYWRNEPYLGFGAGAHGCAGGVRVSNVLRIQTYIERFTDKARDEQVFPLSAATVNQQRLTRRVEMQETLMVGLRLTEEGVSERRFQARFGEAMQDVFAAEIAELTGLGLLEWAMSWAGRCLRLTPHGRLLGNQVFMRFVGD